MSAERLLNIIALCNTAASEVRAGKRLKGVYIRRDYVYVSFGQVLLAQFFDRAEGAALWLLVLPSIDQHNKSKRQCAARSVGRKNCGKKTCRRVGRAKECAWMTLIDHFLFSSEVS